MSQPKKPRQAFEDHVLSRMLSMPPDPKTVPQPKKKPAKKPPKK
jgi:hypothetical protein